MKKFSKYLVRDNLTVDSIMLSNIGASWDSIKEYPQEYPALLIIDECNKNFDYIYPSIFEEDNRSVGDCVYFAYIQGRSKCLNPKLPCNWCAGVCDGFTSESEYK